MLDQQTLKLLLNYDPETGVFVWNVSRRKCKAGAVAGNPDGHGYLRVMVEGVEYRAHRLVWFYMTGKWPENEIDHEDRNRSNNRWKNLREATVGEQRQNQSERCDSTSGFRGVGWLARKQKWLVRVSLKSQRRHVGTFDSLLDAIAARLRTERAMFTHAPHSFLN